jgi:hypothetical protein
MTGGEALRNHPLKVGRSGYSKNDAGRWQVQSLNFFLPLLEVSLLHISHSYYNIPQLCIVKQWLLCET